MTIRTPETKYKRKIFVFALAAMVLTALAWYVNTHVSLADMALQESRLRTAISLHPWRSFGIGCGIYLGLAVIPGTGGKGIVYGWLFGFWQALVIVTVGLALAAMAMFTLSRYLFRESIERRHANFVSLLNKHLDKEGVFYLLTLRMAHAPFSIINPVCGASRISSWTFLWTTVVGLLPANAIWVYVGVRLPSLAELANSGPDAFLDLPLLVALVVCAGLPLFIRWVVSHFGIPASKTADHLSASPKIHGPNP